MIPPSIISVIRHLVATTRIGFRTWIWSRRHGELGQKWLVDFSTGKIWQISFDCSNNTDAIDVKIDCSVHEKKSFFKILGLQFFLLKLPPGKLDPWFFLQSFFLLRLLWTCINLFYGHAWNTVVISGLVPLLISYKNGYRNMLNYWSFTGCLSWTYGPLPKSNQLNSFP